MAVFVFGIVSKRGLMQNLADSILVEVDMSLRMIGSFKLSNH